LEKNQKDLSQGSILNYFHHSEEKSRLLFKSKVVYNAQLVLEAAKAPYFHPTVENVPKVDYYSRNINLKGNCTKSVTT
jgi:hypothetical protein